MANKKVLFVCIHNSARSVMAEALLNQLCGEQFEAQSAGLEPGKLNPLAVEALKEIGLDVSDYQPRAVFDVIKSGEIFANVITVCDETSAERCPVFPGVTERLHWSFADPSALEGDWETKLAGTRAIRDQIRQRIEADFCPAKCI